jgi:serine protease Do
MIAVTRKLVVFALLIGLPPLLAAQTAAVRSLPDFTQLVEDTSPAVVNISTTQKTKTAISGLPEGIEIPDLPEDHPLSELFKHFFGQGGEFLPEERDSKSLGSGFIISPDGYVLTNYHVVKDADEIIARLSDRRELQAEVVGLDKRSDVALLKIDASNLPVAKVGTAKNLKVGEWVLAIGSPFGFDHSATVGIVSAKGRSLPRENYVPFIQTDVAINPGNSGGPLYNLDGEVVGVNSQIFSQTGGYMGLSFAIPIDVAMDVADQLKAKGHVSRGWLGVMIQDVTFDLAESFGMSKPRGALVAQVLPDSPAADSGIKVGDVIVTFDGKDVSTSASLPPIVGSTKAGVTVPVNIIRNGRSMVIRVKLGELPEETAQGIPATGSPELTERLGISVLDLTDELRAELGIEENGVLVERVRQGAASRAGIRKGDVIMTINNEPVPDVSAFRKIVDKLPAGKSVAVLIQRDGNPIFLALRAPEEE